MSLPAGPRLGDVGELDILRRLQPHLASSGGPLVVGPGDDAAVWAPPPGTEVVVTTDSLVEAVHFLPPRSEADAEAIGWKLLAVSLSDLAAMGADPGPAFLALALPADWPVAWLERLHIGVAECAVVHGATVAGGNLSVAPWPVLTSTCLGTVPAGRALRRAGALPGWRLAVTGRVGGAAAGLASIGEGTDAGDPDLAAGWRARLLRPQPRLAAGLAETATQPVDPAAAAWQARLLRPQPRLVAGRTLREAGVTVALDVSDGLYVDAARLLDPAPLAPEPAAAAPGAAVPTSPPPTGLLLQPDALPLDTGLAGRPDALLLAGGGEDYEILFAAPPDLMAVALAALSAVGVEATVIGTFDEGAGVRLSTPQGEVPPPQSGHLHFAG